MGRISSHRNDEYEPSEPADLRLLGTQCKLLAFENLQLGYTLPQAWTKKIGIEKLRVYVSGQNLFSFNSFYQGWDPENEIGTGDSPSYYPITAIYSFGFNFKF